MVFAKSTLEIILPTCSTEGQASSPWWQIRRYCAELTQTFLCSQFKSQAQEKSFLLPWWATRHKEVKEKKNCRYSLNFHLLQKYQPISQGPYRRMCSAEQKRLTSAPFFFRGTVHFYTKFAIYWQQRHPMTHKNCHVS